MLDTATLLLVAFSFLNGSSSAQSIESKPVVAVESETILTGLNRPTGIAVAPGGTTQIYTLFVAEQGAGREKGAGRVVKWQSGAADSVAEVITGLATSADTTAIGLRRLGICFHGRQRLLVVGDVSPREGYALVFSLPTDGEILVAEHPKQRLDRTVGPDAKFGQFFDMAGDKHSFYLATRSAAETATGTVFRSKVQSTLLGEFKPLIELGEIAGQVAMALNPKRGKEYLAVTRSNSDGSILTIHDPISGKTLLEAAVGIQQIVALAYSPKSSRLYAAVSDGIYRLDAIYRDGKQVCHAVSIAKCPQPTDMVFAPDGSLLVAALSEPDADAKNQGVVIKLHGNL